MENAKKNTNLKVISYPGRETVLIKDKCLLTLEEAAKYTGLGTNKLREISNSEDCQFVLWNGAKRMLKREKLISYLESTYSI